MNAKDELLRLRAEGGSHARIKYLRNKIKRETIAGLRKLLRERGVRFNEFKLMTQWAGALGESVEAYPTDMFPDKLLVKHAFLTPSQAIAATLGAGTCHDLGGTDSNGQQVFNCDKCGCVLSLYDCEGVNTLCTSFIFDYPRYCPECGRKVVGE